MDLDKVFEEKKPEKLKALLPDFRECKTYADRLAFWDRHNLHLCVTHYLFQPTNFDKMFISNHAATLKTVEEQIKGGVISIEPHTDEEIEQFVKWGEPIRKKMWNRIQPYHNNKYNEFLKEGWIQVINATHPLFSSASLKTSFGHR